MIFLNGAHLQIIGFDPITTEAEAKAAGIEKMELEQIWPLADYITVHTPLIPSTKGIIFEKVESEFKLKKKSVNRLDMRCNVSQV